MVIWSLSEVKKFELMRELEGLADDAELYVEDADGGDRELRYVTVYAERRGIRWTYPAYVVLS